MVTEEEVATTLSNNRHLVAKVSYYLEKVLNRDFRLNVQPGTAIFSLDSTDRNTGLASELNQKSIFIQVLFASWLKYWLM